MNAVGELNLDTLDALPAGDLVLFCASDERPLLAAAGYVDWRVNGWLSRLLIDGVFVGREGECLLTPGQGRIPPERIFLFGLGEGQAFVSGRAENLGERCAAVLAEAKTDDIVLGQPGVGDRDAHQALLAALAKRIDRAKMTTWGSWPKIAM
jgi:hypothetical protein